MNQMGRSAAREALASLLVDRESEIAIAWADELCRPRSDRPQHHAPEAKHLEWIRTLLPAMVRHLRDPESTDSLRVVQRLVAHGFTRDLSPMLVIEGQICLRRIIAPLTVERHSDEAALQLAALEALCEETEFHIIGAAEYCAELTSELSSSIDRVAALHEIEETIASSLQWDEVLQKTAGAMRTLIPFDRISLALLDETREEFVVSSLETEAESKLGKGARIPAKDSRPGEACRTGRICIERDVQEQPRYWEDGLLLSEGIRSCLVMPLRTKDGLVGTLNFGSRLPGQYEQQHADAVWRVSRQIAVAVENARLYGELQQSHDQLGRTHRELERLNELKSQFLANTSHELRTPLVSLMGYMDMLMGGKLGGINEKQRKGLDICSRNVHRLHRLIEDLLEAAHLDRGSIEPQYSPFDLVKVIRSCLREHASVIESKRIHVDTEMPASPVRVRGDEARLSQAIYHVLSNALKFAPEGGQIHVATAAAEDEGNASVRITDNGPGIPEADLPYVFEPFRQVDGSMTRRHGGFGLGLSIARQIVEAHGGNIAIETQEGKGTSVTFTIRLALGREE